MFSKQFYIIFYPLKWLQKKREIVFVEIIEMKFFPNKEQQSQLYI